MAGNSLRSLSSKADFPAHDSIRDYAGNGDAFVTKIATVIVPGAPTGVIAIAGNAQATVSSKA